MFSSEHSRKNLRTFAKKLAFFAIITTTSIAKENNKISKNLERVISDKAAKETYSRRYVVRSFLHPNVVDCIITTLHTHECILQRTL